MSSSVPAHPADLNSSSSPQHAPTGRPWWRSVANLIPNVVVFALLAGVFYAGHRTGWKLPAFSSLRGSAPAAADDWCSEHLVPESQCVECQKELYPKPKPFGFCREHGVAECVIHHPELAQVKSEPRLPKYDSLKALALLPRPENNSRDTLHTNRIQFASAESIARAGIDVDVVQERPMRDVLTANGELRFAPTRVAHLASRVPGSIALVFKTLGEPVSPGEILALVDAAQVGQLKSQFVQAVVQLQLRQATAERLRTAGSSGAIAQKTVIEADAALQEAEVSLVSTRQALANLGFDVPDDLAGKDAKLVAQTIRFLGIPTSLISSLPGGTQTANLIPIRSTYGGVLVNSEVVAGEVVDTASSLFTVADPSQLWLVLNVRQEDSRYVTTGLPVVFRTDDGSGEVTGQVAWISPAIDPQTRTLQVRVEVLNPSGTLRDKSYGTGTLLLRQEPNAITVPKEAIQSTSDAHFVFVRDKSYFEKDTAKLFHVRQVRIGAKDGNSVELLAGVLPGEVVATKGSSVLLAQLLRNNLGAGCGCHEE